MKIQEQQNVPGPAGDITQTRVREIDGDKVPKGAIQVPDDTPVTDWTPAVNKPLYGIGI